MHSDGHRGAEGWKSCKTNIQIWVSRSCKAASVYPTPIVHVIIGCSHLVPVRKMVCAGTVTTQVSTALLDVHRHSHLNPLSHPWSDCRPHQQSDCRKDENEDNCLVFCRISLKAGCKYVLLSCPFAYRQVLLHTKLSVAILACSSLDHSTILCFLFGSRLSSFVTGKLNECTVGETCAFAEGGGC